MSDLYRDDYYTLRVDHGVLRLIRSSTGYPSIEAFHQATRAMADAVRASGMKRVLLDLRAGPPGRNDAAFEQATSVWRKQLAASADRFAILVRTAAGKLQSQRLSKSDQRAPSVFMDEAEAIAYLTARS